MFEDSEIWLKGGGGVGLQNFSRKGEKSVRGGEVSKGGGVDLKGEGGDQIVRQIVKY